MANIPLDELPEGLLSEILIRLPVKSVLVCKSVSKPWLSTISNPNFSKRQLHHSIAVSRYHPTLLNIIDKRMRIGIDNEQLKLRQRQLINQALLDTNAMSKIPLQIDRVVIPDCFCSSTRFAGCYNGIVCLSNGYVACLWNPSIRQFKILQFLNGTTFPIPESVVPTVVFGYDDISNDYKVLRFVYQNREDVGIAQVYSVNANSCRQLQAPVVKTRCGLQLTNVVVNGVLYFNVGNEIVSFDLHEEVFGLVLFPSSIQRKRSDVLNFKGFLAMVFESGPGVVDLWTLDDRKLSWTKKFSFGCGLDDLDTEIWLSSYVGAGQFCGIKLLQHHFVYDVVYDYEKKETKCYGLQEHDNIYAWDEDSVTELPENLFVPVHTICKYTETLVALEGFVLVEDSEEEWEDSEEELL